MGFGHPLHAALAQRVSAARVGRTLGVSRATRPKTTGSEWIAGLPRPLGAETADAALERTLLGAGVRSARALFPADRRSP